jgi:hypothetical protein
MQKLKKTVLDSVESRERVSVSDLAKECRTTQDDVWDVLSLLWRDGTVCFENDLHAAITWCRSGKFVNYRKCDFFIAS